MARPFSVRAWLPPDAPAGNSGPDPDLRVQAEEGEIERIVDHMGSMIDEMMNRNFFRSSTPDSWQPALNVYEAPGRFLVCVDLAGMDRREIEVWAEDTTLHVNGVRPKPAIPGASEGEDLSVHVMEIDSGRFHRKVPIPPDVDCKAIRAIYRHGFLWIVMPRTRS